MTSWLHRYGNRQHEWHRRSPGHRTVYERQLGLVESSFDTDGVHFGGRADLTHSFEFEIKTTLGTGQQLLDRITLAWTVLRLHHVLMLAKAGDRQVDDGDGRRESQRVFVVDVPTDTKTVLEEARDTITTLLADNATTPINDHDFRTHALNTARILDPTKSSSHLFVLPLTKVSEDNRYRLPLMIVLAHSITDGLSLFHWLGHFNDLLNKSQTDLQHLLTQSLHPDTLFSRLPPAQEDLYPPITGSPARQRWFWLLTRILRHVHKPPPQGFRNPLRRTNPKTLTFPSKYTPALDYTSSLLPPLNSASCTPTMSIAASRRLATICRAAGTSIGAGVFALVGLVMMRIEERIHPSIPLNERKPFIASFPLNPRPFFNYTGPSDSCMLAFSDGIALPFLPSSLPLEGSLRLLAKAAHRQLKTFQKRKTPGLDSNSPLRMLATNYVSAVERSYSKLPPSQKQISMNPQGSYTVPPTWTLATCGVSSVGRVKDCAPGKYDLSVALGGEEEEGGVDLIADFRALRGGVRAREGEFLCGNSTDSQGRLDYAVSYDASAMDEELVALWQREIETVLEPEGGSSRL